MKNLYLAFCVSLFSLFSFAQKDVTYQLSSHILDISKGLPASGVTISLEKYDEPTKTWSTIDEKVTDENGRIPDFLESNTDNLGIYKLIYWTTDYFKSQQTESFYPFIEVVFQIKDNAHYHVPITLSPYGYSTYRGN